MRWGQPSADDITASCSLDRVSIAPGGQTERAEASVEVSNTSATDALVTLEWYVDGQLWADFDQYVRAGETISASTPLWYASIAAEYGTGTTLPVTFQVTNVRGA